MNEDGTMMTDTVPSRAPLADDRRPNRGAIVVGASRGIGRRIVGELVTGGYPVAALARNAAGLHSLQAEAPAGWVRAYTCDAAQPEQLADAMAAARGVLPPLGVVVHCSADSGPVGPIWEADLNAVTAALSVNVTSAFLTARLALAEMVGLGTGRLILLSSGAGRRPTRFRSVYGGSKASVDHLVWSAGEELAARAPGVAITGIYPGIVATDMQAELRHRAESATAPDVREEMAALVARVSEPVSPESVATSIVELLDREAAAVNGKILALRKGEWQEV